MQAAYAIANPVSQQKIELPKRTIDQQFITQTGSYQGGGNSKTTTPSLQSIERT
jgi:hypothetical protein